MTGVNLKSEAEIKIMAEGGKRLSGIREYLIRQIKPGIKTIELENMADREILAAGGEPSFKTVKDYKHSVCVSVNEEVVHGIPGERVIKENDVVGIDIGLLYKGFHTDTAWTVLVVTPVGCATHTRGVCEVHTPRVCNVGCAKFTPVVTPVGCAKFTPHGCVTRFLKVGEETLEKAINVVKPGGRIGQISQVIEQSIKEAGYSPVKVLTGHGVGRKLHEEPAIPQVLLGRIEDTPEILPGMTLAIEVIYNLDRPEVVLKEDGWTIVTEDGKISATFEKTIAVLENGVIILTP